MSARCWKQSYFVLGFVAVTCMLRYGFALNVTQMGSPQGQTPSTFTLDGKITDASRDKITINTEENILFHVRYDDKTEIERSDGSDASAKDLRVGVRVHIVGDLEESGEIAASKIVLLDKPARTS